MLSHNAMARPPAKKPSLGFSFFTSVFAALSLMMILSVSAQAATPPAGATISNQATANYKDSGGSDQVASSNLVTTTVAQVGSYTLTSDNTKIGAAGTTVYMPHTLTNTGNGTDSFNLSLPTSGIDTDLNSVSIFADTDGNGTPDGAALCSAPTCTAVSTGPLATGTSYNFIVAFSIKATAANGAIDPVVVTAVPASTAPLLDTYPTGTLSTNGASYGANHEKINTDNLTVNNTTPVFAVTKSIVGQTSGPIGSDVVYKLSYTNSGNAAGPLYIKDVIGTGFTASYSYVTGATWSNSGATVLTDTTGGDPSGIDYAVTTTGLAPSAQSTIEAIVLSVPANASGFITFKVHVDLLAPLGTSETTNVASYARSNDGTVDCTTLTQSPTCTVPPASLAPTNQSPFTVIGTYNVIANDNGTSSTNAQDGTVAGDNLVDKADYPSTLTQAAPGAVVSFDDYIWNTGDSPDTFNISYNGTVPSQNSFPTGTVFTLFQSDGNTPLLSSDADGVPDTGSVSVGGFYKVVVKATLPANACTVIDCTSPTLNKDFTLKVTATSKGTPTTSNDVYNQLGTITPPSVDLTNDGTTLGAGAGAADLVTPITAVITTKTVAPGSAAQFDLSVTNNGLAIDTFDFDYHLTSGSTIALNSFVPGTSLSGWSVVIHSGSCSVLGPVVSNTSSIDPAATATFCAVVNTPASGLTAAAGTYNAYFKVTSGSTGASDIKLDAVTLSQTNNLTLTPFGSGQIQPGGTILYPHTLANGGNSVCTGTSGSNTFAFDVTNSGAANGWTYVLYYDVNGNGTVESTTDIVIGGGSNASDPGLVSTIPSIAAGTNVKLLVKVQAPSGASSGANSVITVTAKNTTCGNTAPVTDTTTVLAGQIRLDKTQALGTCTTMPVDGAYTGSGTILSQIPGGCVWYRVLGTNQGDAPVTLVKINDATPTFTTYVPTSGACSNVSSNMAGITVPTVTAPASAVAGSVICDNWSTIPAAGVVRLDFAVKIDQ